MVIDTWGTGGPGIYSCTCTVTLNTKISRTTTVTVQEYPGVETDLNCASKLRITSTTSAGFTETGCSPIPATSVDNFGTADMLTLTLTRAENGTQWKSGHCILISPDISSSLEITVNCNKNSVTSDKPSTVSTSASTKSTSTPPTSPPTPPPPTTTTTTKMTTTEKPPFTSTKLMTTLSTDLTTGDVVAVSSTMGETGKNAKNLDADIGIIAGTAGGGGLLVVIAIIVGVVISRRRKPDIHQPVDRGNTSNGNTNDGYDGDIQPYAITGTMKKYVNSDGDTITHNSLYESAGPRDPDDSHIVTGTGDMYAQVRKSDQYSTIKDTEIDRLELEETPKGDVYAVVNKSKKEKTGNESGDNRPSRYRNADGLVYAEVSAQDETSRPQSRVKSRPPPVSPKPKADSGNVVYAEVNTGV
ncbi:protein let-653-like [Pecten maximus]|uniref:protein let-653-like n=1 Tax=Pecten maximus TaxID=6579 RepID=UPI001458F2B0|nr:protein let-653-like [Pecten maximus]